VKYSSCCEAEAWIGVGLTDTGSISFYRCSECGRTLEMKVTSNQDLSSRD